MYQYKIMLCTTDRRECAAAGTTNAVKTDNGRRTRPTTDDEHRLHTYDDTSCVIRVFSPDR